MKYVTCVNILLYCKGPSVPHTILYSISEEQILHGVELYDSTQELSDQMAWPQQKDFELKLEGDFVARIRMLIPPEVIENEGVQHPTIIFVSGIPGEQVVNYKWGADFATYLASNKSWVVVLMDVRGSGGEELSREYQPAWNLGHYEALDHLSIAKYLGENFDLVDEKRIGVLGKGHGGYNALRMLSCDKHGVIACTAAINPITDWMNYASYYSEKFMGTARVVPGGNFRGYEDSTLLRRGMDYFNKSLYIIHGSADTDVLYSHTLKFSKELIREGVLFRQQSYADDNHSLEDSLLHVYRSLEEYFANCFPPFEEEEVESILELKMEQFSEKSVNNREK
ncbi:Venom dipeptidyl peptidase 4 [Armadillidium nasatum]|uniref:Venom dipeptidyl peptidase 4 n=1 Tax=Armadillidium nasatum TaxID=96803 RepID=A0A5N5TGL0_9CRUS|nr:Venom dipeptidyl peptidase 4 [Armadillidium nasatum]